MTLIDIKKKIDELLESGVEPETEVLHFPHGSRENRIKYLEYKKNFSGFYGIVTQDAVLLY